MLRFEHLFITRDSSQIIHDCSLHVASGELVVLLGANGSGKTTLARTLAGHPFYTITYGDILLNVESLSTATPTDRAKKGLFVSSQIAPSIEGISVRSLLYRMYQLHKKIDMIDFTRVVLEPLATSVGLNSAITERSFEQLSGGEFKRVELLSYLIAQPLCAWFDELDSGLDAAGKSVFVSLINQKRAQYPERMHVVVTHDLDCAQALRADRVYILDDGKISHIGSADLITHYKTGASRGL